MIPLRPSKYTDTVDEVILSEELQESFNLRKNLDNTRLENRIFLTTACGAGSSVGQYVGLFTLTKSTSSAICASVL